MLEAARVAFCEAGFDHIGVRDIAARAATDPAIVIRLFGSKEALFQAVADDAFGLEEAFTGAPATMGQVIAGLLLGPQKIAADADSFDAFRFLLNSCTSPVAAPILSAALHAAFVAPLGVRLGGGADAEGKAALVTACVLGLTTMRFALASPALRPERSSTLEPSFAAAIQACIDAR